MAKAKLGFRIPSFPIDGSGGKEFSAQILRSIGGLEQDFDSAWVDDHFVPWADFVPRTAPNL